MKIILFGLLAVACIAFAAGCTSINTSDAGDLAIYPKTIGPTDNYRPLYSIDTKRKVTGDASASILFGIFMWSDCDGIADNTDIYGNSGIGSALLSIYPSAKRLAAQGAFYNACRDANCDAVVSARYKVTFKDYLIFKKCHVEIKGFPATLSGVEAVKPVQYYIDPDGNVVFLDKFINPVKIDGGPARAKNRTVFWFF